MSEKLTMIDRRRYRVVWRGRYISLLLALSLALSLPGPISALPQVEGFIPICTGGEIVYIPAAQIGLDRPTENAPAPASESCPWFTKLHAVAVAPITAVAGTVVYKVARFPPTDTAAAGQQTPGSFQARAPPQRDA